jgi:hypothetical protein
MRQASSSSLALRSALALHVTLLALGLPALLASPVAQAQAASADELIEQGIAQRRAGDDAGALATFRQAYAASPTPRAAAQLGLVHQALGQWVEAHTRLNEALATTGDAWIERNRAALSQALGVVDGEVGTVEILISGSLPRGARATLGAVEITEFPMSRPLVAVAGEEELEVSAPGHRTVRRDVRVRAGQLSRVTVELRPDTTAEAGAGQTGEAGTGAGEDTGTGEAAREAGTGEAGTGTGTGEQTDAGGGSDDWIVWGIVGGVVVVGVGVAVGVIASQQSLEAPLPGTAGAVELLRF